MPTQFSESDILARIAQLKSSRKNLIAGDDIACFRSAGFTYAGTDSLIENVHYRRGWLSPADIAYKLFARNWSDFLCKGIQAEYALLNLNLKRASATAEFLIPFLRELDRLFTRYNITLVGGDTARAQADGFTMTLLGSKGKFIPRQGRAIQAGDLIVQLGTVGGSDLARKHLAGSADTPQRIRKMFARPQIFDKLPAAAKLKAALDQSDSVDKTLRLLAQSNKACLHIDIGAIAVSHADIRKPRSILAAAEDLAVFAVAAKGVSPFRVIGHIESCGTPGVVYRHGGKIVSYADGFEHFNARRREAGA